MKLPLERHTSDDIVSFCWSFEVEELEKAYEEIKQKYDETLKKLKDKEDTSIGWSVEDFLTMAIQNEFDEISDIDPNLEPTDITMENAKEYLKKYDPDKFEDALCEMIRKHDAEIGITWDTIDYYLDEYCLRKES